MGDKGELQAKSVHLWLFVDVILSGVAETILESPCLLSKRPNQAFPCGKSPRFAAECGVFKSQGGINPLPSGGLEGIHNVKKDESIQGIEMHQQRVANVPAENVES